MSSRRGERLDDEVGADEGEPLREIDGRLVRADRRRASQEHRAGIETGVHEHRGDAGLGLSFGDRPLDRRGAAVLRQQRRVDVDAAVSRNVEQGLREDAAVGEDDSGVRGERRDQVARLVGADLRGLVDGNAEAIGGDLHFGRMERLLAADGAVGLREHRRDVVAGVDEGLECRHGDGRRAHEDQSHGGGGYSKEETWTYDEVDLSWPSRAQ